MTVSVVNGFVCYSSCDVSKAKKGEDPYPSTGSGNVDKENAASSAGRADQLAVVFGGSLGTSAADSVTAVESALPANSTGLSRSKFLVDVLA
jgi:hypothetical protein